MSEHDTLLLAVDRSLLSLRQLPLLWNTHTDLLHVGRSVCVPCDAVLAQFKRIGQQVLLVTIQIATMALVDDARFHEFAFAVRALLEFVLIAGTRNVVVRVIEEIEVVQLVHRRGLVGHCTLLAAYRVSFALLRQGT